MIVVVLVVLLFIFSSVYMHRYFALFINLFCFVVVHGAGLGHMLYMKPNSIVVEIAPTENDGRLHLGEQLCDVPSYWMAHSHY